MSQRLMDHAPQTLLSTPSSEVPAAKMLRLSTPSAHARSQPPVARCLCRQPGRDIAPNAARTKCSENGMHWENPPASYIRLISPRGCQRRAVRPVRGAMSVRRAPARAGAWQRYPVQACRDRSRTRRDT